MHSHRRQTSGSYPGETGTCAALGKLPRDHFALSPAVQLIGDNKLQGRVVRCVKNSNTSSDDAEGHRLRTGTVRRRQSEVNNATTHVQKKATQVLHRTRQQVAASETAYPTGGARFWKLKLAIVAEARSRGSAIQAAMTTE